MHIHTKTRVLALMLALCLLLCACGGAPAAESPVDLRLIWHGNEVAPEMCFGDVTAMPDDNLLVEADGKQVTDFSVASAEPEVMRVERTADGRICLTKLQSFGGRNIGFTLTYDGKDYAFYCNDDGLASLRLIWHGSEVAPEMCFGDVTAMPDDNLLVEVDGEQVTDFTVASAEPEVMRVERTADGRICLTKLQSFGGRVIDFTVTYGGKAYSFCCNDDGLPMDGTQQSEPPQTSDSSQEMPPQEPDSGPDAPPELGSVPVTPQEETASPIEQRRYSDDELQAFVDANLSFGEACDKIATVADAVRYLYLRGYQFAPDDAGVEAETRYRLNSGACVGGSALFSALLEGDHDEQGYLYIFYARGEHVIDYFALDGVYYFCDFVSVFSPRGTQPDRSPVCHVTTDPATIYEAWFDIEPNDLNDSESDMYLAAMYTTGYFGTPTMPQVWLWASEDGKYCRVDLSAAEKASMNVLFVRDGYTFEF